MCEVDNIGLLYSFIFISKVSDAQGEINID